MSINHRRRARGFTLIEVAVVVAIIAIVAAIAGANISRLRPRATLASVSAELQALIHGARQTALATGHDIIVMLFPLRTGKGARVILYEDAAYNFVTGGPAGADFGGYDCEKLSSGGGQSQVLDSYDLPTEITFGPDDGMGTGAKLAAPLDQITVDKACSFCSTDTSKNLRGAIRFDSHGAATFYAADAVKRPDGLGASFTLTNPTLGSQRITFVILSSTGAVQLQQN